MRLSYELSVHPGESLADLEHAIRNYVLPIRERLCLSQRTGDGKSRDNLELGVAPRIGRALLAEFQNKERLEQHRSLLAQHNLVPATVNAFPLENFHAQRVKEQVYSPPWTDPERADLTIAIADVLAALLPATQVGTISTSGGTYRPWGHDARTFAAMAKQYRRVVDHLASLEQDRGITILLAVEPEPDTTFETAQDVIAWVEDHALPGMTAEQEVTFRRFFTINLDICHQSVLFRDPVAEWQQLESAGLRVSKLHITSALRCTLSGDGVIHEKWQTLLDYSEPRYLHQFAGRRANGDIVRGADLPALAEYRPQDFDEVRCHFHVPVSEASLGPLATTQADTQRTLEYALSHRDTPQLVIETYTWPLLADDDSIAAGIVREFEWVLSVAGG